MKTILALVKEASFEWHGACIGGYFGLDAISHLAKTGSMHERDDILDQLLENDLVDLLLVVRSILPISIVSSFGSLPTRRKSNAQSA